MPTPEELLTQLAIKKQNVEQTFKEANKTIEACRQEHAEIIGAIKVCETLIGRSQEEEVVEPEEADKACEVTLQ